MTDRRSGPFKRWLKSSKAFPSVLLLGLLFATLAGCEFEPALTPIDWSTPLPESQQFAEIGSTPVPLPTPTSPFITPDPNSFPFRGEDDLDCGQPKAGDNKFGYCNIPGTQDFYVWGECASDCPESPYPGIELVVASKDDSELFREVIDKRESAIMAKREGNLIGGILGVAGAGFGIPAAGAVCLATLGWGCAFAVGAVVVDFMVAGYQANQAKDADKELNEPLGLEDSARDHYQQVRDQYDPLNERVP